MADIKDLMERYEIAPQSIRRFISRHLSKINADGVEHARQTSEGWIFDSEAVRIIDELRGFSKIAVVNQNESDAIKELQQENENLRNLLLATQSKLIKTQEDLNENQKLLSSVEKKLLANENLSKDNDINLVRVQSNLEIEKTLRQVAENKLFENKTQLEHAVNQIEKLKNRSFIDRIFNKF